MIELLVAIVVVALVGAALGVCVGWLGSWPLLWSIGAGTALAVVAGGIALAVLIVISARAGPGDDGPPS